MKPKAGIWLAVATVAFTCMTGVAQDRPSKVRIVTVFDYPITGISTWPQGINDAGEIVGRIDDNFHVRGFHRFPDGSFMPPIIEPKGAGKGFTNVTGINNSDLLCGSSGAVTDHGFFMDRNGFTSYEIPDAAWTQLYDLNNGGDFCGAFSYSYTALHFEAFVSIGAVVDKIPLPDATTAFAYGINNSGEVAGWYIDSAFIAHSFFRDATGAITAPIDYPGAISTLARGLNDQGLIVGSFVDASGVMRGFVLRLPDQFIVLEKKGAAFTALSDINNNNLMCGRFEDADGISHGIVALLETE
jgi:uncharacterized membrane protein